MNFQKLLRFPLFLALLAVLSTAYLLLNPFWFGDGVWYALEIQERRFLPMDAGHLLWRPFGYLTELALPSAFSEFVRTGALSGTLSGQHSSLTALQLLSSIFTVLCIVEVYLLSARLFEDRRKAALGAVIFSLSHFAVVYGGSGSSYTAAVYFMLLTFRLLLCTHGALAGLTYALSWSMWGLSLLSAPAMLPAFFLGKAKNRLRVFIAFCLSASISAGLLAACGFQLSHPGSGDFIGWLRESSHGIPPSFSLVNAARAPLGFVQSFVDTGSFGEAAKGVLRNEVSVAQLTAMHWDAMLAVLGLSLIFAVQLLRSCREAVPSLLFLLAFAPTFLFASFWQGSDVERFCFTLPFAVLLLLGPVKKRSLLVPAGVVLLLVGVNLSERFTGEMKANEEISERLVADVQRKLQPGDLMIFSGSNFEARFWGPVEYLSGVRTLSLQYQLTTSSPEAWREDLKEAIARTERNGGKTYIHGSLIGEEPLYPLRTDNIQNHPSIEEIRSAASVEKAGEAVQLGRHLFYQIPQPSEHEEGA